MVKSAVMNNHNQDSVFWSVGTTQMPTLAANFFDGIRPYRFVEAVELMLKHKDVAVSEGIVQCMFEENFDSIEYELDPTDAYNQPFQGVRFSFRISWYDPLEYEIVDVPTCMLYVREACEKFLQQHPRYKDDVVETFRSNGLTY